MNSISNMIYRNERAAESTSNLSKAAKFYSAAADFAVKFFNGLQAAQALGAFSAPLKKFGEALDLFNFLDLINGQIYYPGKPVKTAAKVAIIGAVVLGPVVFASSTLGLFSLGFLGANIATYGSMTAIGAIRSGLVLSSTLLGMFDKYGPSAKAEAAKKATEIAEARLAKSQWKQYKVLKEVLDGDTDIHLAEVRFKNTALKTDMTVAVIARHWEFLANSNIAKVESNRDLIETSLKFFELKKDETELAVRKSELAIKEDLVKVTSLSCGFLAAFAAPVLSSMVAVSALGLYSAHVGWEKGDIDLQITKKSVERFELYRDNQALLTNPELAVA